jgi:protein phosphatase
LSRKHFLSTEVLSSDVCRGMVSDDENDQAVTQQAFDELHFIARKRLALGKLTVVSCIGALCKASIVQRIIGRLPLVP